MLYTILGYLLISAPFAVLFWIALVAAKRKEESHSIESSEASESRELKPLTRSAVRMDFTQPR
jgi:hypothetical protein